MNWGNIHSEIIKGLQNVPPTTKWDERDLLLRANIAQREIVNVTDCVTKNYSTTSVATTQEYTLPTDYIRIKRLTYLGKKLWNISITQLDISEVTNRISSPWTDDNGTPTHYYENKNKVGLYPNPDTTGDAIIVDYIYQVADLIDETSVPFDGINYMYPYHQYLIYHVLWRCFLELEEDKWKNSAMIYNKMYQDGINLINHKDQSKPDMLTTFDLILNKSDSDTGPLPGITI